MGWKGESRRHSLSRKGIKTNLPDGRRFDVSNYVARGKIPEFDVSRHNWSFKINPDGTMKVSLGNFSDAGWFWSGDESDLNLFLYRIMNSQVKDEFMQDMKDKGITFKMLLPQIIKSMDSTDGNGMYAITGDNGRWKFGESFEFEVAEELSYFEDNYELSKDDLKEIEDAYYIHMSGDNVNLDKFEKTDEYAEIKKKFLHEVKTSYDFEDFDANMQSLEEDVMYIMHDYDMQIFNNDFGNAFDKWLKKKKEEGRIVKEFKEGGK